MGQESLVCWFKQFLGRQVLWHLLTNIHLTAVECEEKNRRRRERFSRLRICELSGQEKA